MFRQYVQHFKAVEINFTYYRLPEERTIGAIAAKSPDDFTFWVKANQATTHRRDRSVAGRFIEGIEPMQAAGKLVGVLLQFPQSFHRTGENRKYLADVIEDFAGVPLAVEFRQNSWQHESTLDGLRERNVTLVIPDVPDIASLFHHSPELLVRWRHEDRRLLGREVERAERRLAVRHQRVEERPVPRRAREDGLYLLVAHASPPLPARVASSCGSTRGECAPQDSALSASAAGSG